MPDWKITVPVTVALKPIIWGYKKSYNAYYKHCKKCAFIFDEYTKQITVYRDGHGILMNTFVINVLNKDQFLTMRRSLDIHDACKDTHFKSIEEMSSMRRRDRFDKMGFWYEPKEYINRIIPHIDESSKNLEWSFQFDKSKIINLKDPSFYMSYSLSIPKMFPVSDNYFDAENAPSGDNLCTTYLEVRHKVKKFTYIVSFEKNMKFEQYPSFKNYPSGIDHGEFNEIKLEDKSDIFYNRYVGSIKNPILGSAAAVNWKFKRQEAAN